MTIDDKARRLAQDLDSGLWLEWIRAADEIAPVAGPILLVLVGARWMLRRLLPSTSRNPL